MFEELLQPAVQQFITDHAKDDVKALLLKHKTIFDLPASVIADQISGKEKARTKLPSYYNSKEIIFPPNINIEQCSSEKTAAYKIELVKFLVGKNFSGCVDLTGGLGIDSFYFSKLFNHVDYVDPNEKLLEIAKHNHTRLGAENISYHASTAEEFIHDIKTKYDLVFIDPSRRNENVKTFLLKDCLPDITKIQDSLFDICKHLLVKASPLLDIQSGVSELKFVKHVSVVSVDNECKEVLFFCEKEFQDEPLIEAINMGKDEAIQKFSFHFSREKQTAIKCADKIGRYLYEPNASILKAGAFKTITNSYEIQKLEINTHLYTSSHLIDPFPGRVFEIEGFVKPSKKEIATYFPEGKANITRRNYPLRVDEIKKKTGLKDGGDKFLIAFTSVAGKQLCVAKRIF